MKKVLYVATVASHICQFHLPYLEMLQSRGVCVHVAARDNLAEKNGLQLKFTDKYFDVPFERSPKSKRNIRAYKELKKIISENQYDLIVCNTPMGSILTRLAARRSRKRGAKVIYIAHGFHFYKGAPKKNWIVFYPIEKIFAKLCDTVVTINKEDFEFAKKYFKTQVRHIHGIGVSNKRFHPVDREEKIKLRKTIGLLPDDFIVLCTGELNKNKNQEQLIKSADRLIDKIPNLKILLAGNGPNEQNLLSLIDGLNLKDTVKLLGYRTDLENIIPAVDVVASFSKREGLGLNIIEGMLCGKPIIATYNRGHSELIDNNVNGFLVPIGDVEKTAEKILEIYSDCEKKHKFSLNSQNKSQKYTVDFVAEELTDILFETRSN